MKNVLAIVALLLMLPMVALGQSINQLLIPAYANPCCGGGPAMWQELIAWGMEDADSLAVIFNPASGPGVGAVDPNYINQHARGPLVDLYRTGAAVYGYVDTNYTNRSLASVKADINLYHSTGYWRGSAVRLTGFFIDRMSNDLGKVGYYRQLRDHINALSLQYQVIGNPGVSSTSNASQQAQFDVIDYATVFNTLVVFEQNSSTYFNSYSAHSWLSGLPSNGFAHIVHGLPDVDSLRRALFLANQRDAGLVYFTDDQLFNPYDRLPVFFNEIRQYFRSNTPVCKVAQ